MKLHSKKGYLKTGSGSGIALELINYGIIGLLRTEETVTSIT